MYLETPKDSGGDEGIKLDAENLRVLRSLIAGAEPLAKPPTKKVSLPISTVAKKAAVMPDVKKVSVKKVPKKSTPKKQT